MATPRPRERATIPALLAALALACGGGDDDFTARMAAEHEDDSPRPTAAATAEPASAVATREVAYATIDGREATGYLARPEGAAASELPGLLVIHEWWGLNDNIRAMTRRLAGEGYVALAVDLYGGAVAEDRDGAMALMRQATDHPERAHENLRQARRFLADEGVREVGTIGWCFGGGWSLNAALTMPDEIDATVIYYGRLETDPAKLEALTMPILGIFGGEDDGIPVETVREFESALRTLGGEVEIHVYDGAGHAFANPSGEQYEPGAAEDAWRRTVAFLDRHLASP
jgi:carboxymethylenebutenolidase